MGKLHPGMEAFLFVEAQLALAIASHSRVSPPEPFFINIYPRYLSIPKVKSPHLHCRSRAPHPPSTFPFC